MNQTFRKLTYIITIVSFISANLAYGQPLPVSKSQDKLAKDTELNNTKFIAVSTALGKILDEMNEIIESTSPPDSEKLSALRNRFINYLAFNKPEKDKIHYNNNFVLEYDMSNKNFYFYSRNPRNSPGVIYRIGKTKPLKDYYLKFETPFHEATIGNFYISLFTGPLADDLPISTGKRNLLARIISGILLPIIFIFSLIGPININKSFAQPNQAADYGLSLVDPQLITDLRELIKAQNTSSNFGLSAQYDTSTNVIISGSASPSRALGLSGTFLLDQSSAERYFGGVSTLSYMPSEKLLLSIRSGVLPEFSTRGLTSFAMAGVDTNLGAIKPYLHLGFILRHLDRLHSSANGLLVDSGLILHTGNLRGQVSVSGPIYFRPEADTLENYRLAVSDLSLYRANFSYNRGFWWISGIAELGGSESWSQPIPSNRFSRFGIEGGLRFDIGQLDFVLSTSAERLNPSFSPSGANLLRPSFDINWDNFSLRTGIWIGPFTRPYGELLYRITKEVEIFGGYNPVSLIYTDRSYANPFEPEQSAFFGLRYNLDLPSGDITLLGNTEYPIQSPTGSAVKKLAYGPIAKPVDNLEQKRIAAENKFRKDITQAVVRSTSPEAAFNIFTVISNEIDSEDIGTMAIFADTFWNAFHSNPNLNFFWMNYARKIQTDSNVYKLWHTAENHYSYGTMLKKMFKHKYDSIDLSALQILIFEFNQLLEAAQSDGISTDTIAFIEELFPHIMSMLKKSKPGTNTAIFTYYIASHFFTILTSQAKYPGTETLVTLTEAYLKIPQNPVITQPNITISDRLILQNLEGRAVQAINSDDLKSQIKGLFILQYLLTIPDYGYLADQLMQRLSDIIIYASSTATLPPVVPLTLTESTVPTSVSKDDPVFLLTKASFLALNILFTHGIRPDQNVLDALFNSFRSFPQELQDELKLGPIFHSADPNINILKFLIPQIPQEEQKDDIKTRQKTFRKHSSLSVKHLLSFGALLLLSGCNGSTVGSLSGIIIFTVIATILYIPKTISRLSYFMRLLIFSVLTLLAGCILDPSGIPRSSDSDASFDSDSKNDGGPNNDIIIADGGRNDGGIPDGAVTDGIADGGHINQAPIANAGENQSINENTIAVLDGTRSYDPEGTLIVVTWKQKIEPGTPAVEILDSDRLRAWFITPPVDEDITLAFTLLITDTEGLQSTDEVKIMVQNTATPNNPPIFTPTGNFNITEGQQLQFTVQAEDPDGDSITLSTRNMPEGALFDPAAGTFTWTPGNNQIGEYEIIFLARDEHGATASDTSHIIVSRPDNLSPTTNAQVDQLIAIEGDTITLDATASRDPEGAPLRYNWRILAGNPAYAALSNSHEPIATCTFHDIPDGEEIIYIFEVTVTDGQNEAASRTGEIHALSDTVIQSIPAVSEQGNSPVTLLSNINNPVGRVSTNTRFVINNNAGFTYGNASWEWTLSQNDRDSLRVNGLTYVYNGRNHTLRLTGQDNRGRTRSINFRPEIEAPIDYSLPYRVIIPAADIIRLSGQIELQLNTVNITIANQEVGQPFILTGFQKYFALTLSNPVLNPGQIGSYWQSLNSPGLSPVITPAFNNISISISIADPHQFAAIRITPILNTNNNIASQSNVTASSVFPGYPASNAIDGCFSADFEGQNCEWASLGERTPWITLSWPFPRLIYKAEIRDRANPRDHITNSQLEFPNGTTIFIGELPNDRSPRTIFFSPLDTPSLTFRVLNTGPDSLNPGLNEFQVYEALNQSNFANNGFSRLPINVTGNTAFILRLQDSLGRTLSIPIFGARNDLQGITIDLAATAASSDSNINLRDIRYIETMISGELQTGDASLTIQGLYAEIGNRFEYAFIEPDSIPEEYMQRSALLPKQNSLKSLAYPNSLFEGITIYGVTSWPEHLTFDGLNFQIGSHKFSAFHTKNTIYIPDPDIVLGRLRIPLTNIRAALSKRNRIILEHELHEIKGFTHKDAVLTEFEENINGLNYADIVTILLGILINNDIDSLGEAFHNLFIAELLKQGMPLSFATYSIILDEILGITIDKDIFELLLNKYNSTLTSFIGDKVIYTEPINTEINENRIKDEPGYSYFNSNNAALQKQDGNIIIDLDRFFINNETLSSAITIDAEYFIRFVYFAKKMNHNIRLIGITSKPENNIAINQLLTLLRQNIPKFSVHYNVNFSDYESVLPSLGIKDYSNTVSILTAESARAVKHPHKIKIITSFPPTSKHYNWVTAAWYEFGLAIEGLDKEKDDFMSLVMRIAESLLNEQVTKKQITIDTKNNILSEIRQTGIGLIPSYFDPIQYYKSIESQRILLTSA